MKWDVLREKIISLPIIALFFLLYGGILRAQQFTLHGTVYDYYNRQPLEAVSVFCSCGENTITDSTGKYRIKVSQRDTVWFSYLGKNTTKYPVDTISNLSNFEIGLHIDVAWLPNVKVQNRNYRLDSLQNRQDYAKIFNFRKPGLRISQNPPSSYVPGSVTAALDLDELINMFRFKRNRQMLSFQQRLIQQEQDKYVDHRFNKRIVRQLTHLENPALDTFMLFYRPAYDMVLQMNDLELGYYIEECYKLYLDNKRKGIGLTVDK